MSNLGFSSTLKAVLAAATVTCVFAVTVVTQQLMVRLDGDYLRISVTPHLNFIEGRTLERLEDGLSVSFVAQLTIAPSQNSLVSLARSTARFAISRDVWEHTFTVQKMGERPDSRRSIAHRSAEAAETWCLDNLTIDRSMIPADAPFYVQLDLRAEDPHDQLGIVGESGINITQLIALFAKPVKVGQKHWNFSNGPLLLKDLRKAGQG